LVTLAASSAACASFPNCAGWEAHTQLRPATRRGPDKQPSSVGGWGIRSRLLCDVDVELDIDHGERTPAFPAVAFFGGLATLQRRPSGGVLVALSSGASLTLYLALTYPEPWWPTFLGMATVVAIIYALAFRRSSGLGGQAS